MLLRRFHKDRRKATALGSVIDNLNRMLNTKKGFGFWLQTYGIGDYNEYRSRARIVETLIAEIKTNIATHEPRVQIDQIKEIASDSPFRLKFQMKGTFLEDDKPVFIVVDSLRNNVSIEA